MEKRDMKKENKEMFAPKQGVFSIVNIPELTYITIVGEGDPNKTESFGKATEALYTVAYGIKFALKDKGRDFTVMPLEGLWYCDNMSEFSEDNKDNWKWKLMILQPESVDGEMVETAKNKGKEKKKELKAYIENIQIEKYNEGIAVQTMYIGAYKDETPVIAEMHKFIAEKGYELTGLYHEIYLSDPRKTDESKLKTILRQPVKMK